MEEAAGKDPGYPSDVFISRCYNISACHPSKTKLIKSMQNGIFLVDCNSSNSIVDSSKEISLQLISAESVLLFFFLM